LQDPASLEAAIRGCDTVYHVAADYRLWSRDPRELYRNNVDGTRNLLAAAEQAGVSRFVHCSSVGALGIPKGGTPGTETTPDRREIHPRQPEHDTSRDPGVSLKPDGAARAAC